jgi:hypothetical protein
VLLRRFPLSGLEKAVPQIGPFERATTVRSSRLERAVG